MLIPILSYRPETLCCTLKFLEKHFFHETPADVFVFSFNNTAEAATTNACPATANLSNVYFMAVDEHWGPTPESGGFEDWIQWHNGMFPSNYRLMGHWKISFAFTFAREVGYKHVWQLDDDSFLQGPLGYNAVNRMDERNLSMAGFRVVGDTEDVLWGLAELTRYFIVAEEVVPQLLFKNCGPPNLHGLYTPINGDKNETTLDKSAPHLQLSNKQPGFTGWNMQVIYTNSVMIKVDFWFRQDVQRYLTLVHRTGGVMRFRWTDQPVITMIWLLFVGPENYAKMDFDFCHRCPDRCS